MATQLTPISVYTGTVPIRADQTPVDFATNVGIYLNYFDTDFTPDSNVWVGQVNTLSGEMETIETTVTAKEDLMSPHYTAIDAVYANEADITSVAANGANITSVAANETNIDLVVLNETNITSVATNGANITAVALNETNIDLVAGNEINIDAVAVNEANITAVSTNGTNITAVALNETNINLVAANETNIDAVALNEADIDTIATNIDDVNSVALNMTDINNAEANATAAATSADNAATSASIATGAANYTGDWVASYNTTGYSIGESASYTDGFNYISKLDTNLVEPTTETNTAEWDFLEAVSPSELALKAPLASPELTGVPLAPTASTVTDNTQIATTAFVHAYSDDTKADTASPTFTGTVTMPTVNTPILTESSYKGVTDGTRSATGNYTFDFGAGDMEQATLSGTAITMTMVFTGFIEDKVCSMIVDLVNAGDHTIAYPAGTLFASGIAPSYTSTGTDRIMILKDKDNVYTITVIGLDIKVVA